MTTTFAKHAILRALDYGTPEQTTYTPDTTANHEGGRQMAWYFPAGVPSDYPDVNGAGATEWAGAVLWFDYSGLSTSAGAGADSANATITTSNGVLWQWLMRGLPVARIQVSVGYASAAATPGKGFLHAPGGVERRWESGAYANPLKDAIMAYQFAARTSRFIGPNVAAWPPTITGLNSYGWGGSFPSAQYPIAPRFVLAGNSAGACIASWVGMQPNLAGTLGTGGQHDINTIPAGLCVGLLSVASFDTYVSTDTTIANYFPRANTADDSGESTSSNAEATCIDVARAPRRYKLFASIYPHTARRIPPTIWQSGTAAETTYQFGEPHNTNEIATANIHSSTQGLIMRQKHPEDIKLYLASSIHTAALSGLYDGVLDVYNADGTAGRPRGLFSDHAVDCIVSAKAGRPRWDQTREGLQDGISRSGRVETGGRICVPAADVNAAMRRRGVVVTNCGTRQHASSPSAGNAGMVNDLLVGETQFQITHVIRPGETKFIPGQRRLWFKSSGVAGVSTTDYEASEEYVAP